MDNLVILTVILLNQYIEVNSLYKACSMIFIVSSAGHTVNRVMDWLTYYGQQYIRISDLDEFLNLIHVEIADDFLSIRVKNERFDIDLFDLKVGWVWHGQVQFKGLSIPEIGNISAKSEVTDNLRSQMRTVYGFIEEYINSKCLVGCQSKQDVNKLTVLRIAQKIGLNIPHTFIGTRVSQFQEFGKARELITKSIQAAPFIHDSNGNSILEGYTTVVSPDNLKSLDREHIFPSLVQEKLDKKYEIRVFYLDGKCYSMAIFSQRDKKTTIDFRKYNNVTPNRMMKCLLPHELEKKIVELMNKIGLNTGSLDFVKTKDNKYVFLEVNPVGQFGFVSDHCNYDLERLIAEKLISYAQI